MSLSTFSSDRPRIWRRFFRLMVGTAAVVAGVLFAFVVLVDPFDTLPWSPALDRVPVTSNQRFSYPALARSARFDSAVFGTSTSRLLRPAALDPAFGARFANLAMNDATPFEISSLLGVFVRAHPAAKVVMLGLEERWCVTGEAPAQLTPRAFPAWMYAEGRWMGYREMFNLFAMQEAVKEFGVLTGLKAADMGRDGYTRFVPPDAAYDPVRAGVHLAEAGPRIPGGARVGAPAGWRFPALEMLRQDLAKLPGRARVVLFFVPYYYRLLAEADSEGGRVWAECKARVAAMARRPDVTVVDFMRLSPITERDENYWDPLHYRVAVADRLARDLTAAVSGAASVDYRLLAEAE